MTKNASERPEPEKTHKYVTCSLTHERYLVNRHTTHPEGFHYILFPVQPQAAIPDPILDSIKMSPQLESLVSRVYVCVWICLCGAQMGLYEEY